MAVQCPYQFSVVLISQQSPARVVGQLPVTNEHWRPALEWACFAEARADPRRPPRLPSDPGAIEPVWQTPLGQPYLAGFRLTLTVDGQRHTHEFASDYFHQLGQRLLETSLAGGQATAEDACAYVVCAVPKAAAPAAAPAARAAWSVKPVPQPLAVEELPWADVLPRCAPYGTLDDESVPVLVPEEVLLEIKQAYEAAGAVETGGHLVGHLHRDPTQLDRYFVRVTAQIPARHTQQEATRLTFTPETWADVDGLLRERGRHERRLGWWHSHPARRWCDACPPEKRRTCRRRGDFFSSHDAALHLATYPLAYNVALVVSDSYASGLTFALYGWRRGILARRGFHLLDGVGALPSPDPLVPTCEDDSDDDPCERADEFE
jgi:hypothetical protein